MSFPTTLPETWWRVVVAFIAYCTVHAVSIYALGCRRRVVVQWLALSNAAIVFFSVWVVPFKEDTSDEARSGRLFTPSSYMDAVYEASMGYFLYDLILVAVYYSEYGASMLVHCVSTLIICGVPYTGRILSGWLPMALSCEGSSVLLNISHLADSYGFTRAKIPIFLTFFVSFVVLRFGVFAKYAYLWYGEYSWYLSSSAGVPAGLTPAQRAGPHFFTVMTTLFFSLNVYFFWRMVIYMGKKIGAMRRSGIDAGANAAVDAFEGSSVDGAKGTKKDA